MNITSKLPTSGTTIFTVMSQLAVEHQAINLGQGFPDFDCDPTLKALVSKHLEEGKNQYCPMAGLPALRQTLTQKAEKLYGLNLNPDTQICITAGATQAIFTAIQAFIHAGDEVIIIEPAYDCYKPAVKIAGGICKPYGLKLPDYKVDWNVIESMVTNKTRMIIINSPHNPTGSILVEEDLIALEQIVKDRDIIVLSDEVYEHLIYDDELHQSVMRYPNLFQQSLAVFSLGKTLHATGWKVGYIIGSDYLISEFKNIHQWNVFCVNSFVQHAVAEYLTDPATYEGLPQFFQRKRDLLASLLKPSPLVAIPSRGTYFQLYDYSAISSEPDTEFAKYLTAEVGVAAIPQSPFYTEDPNEKVIRFCFAKNEETLYAAAEKLNRL